MCLSATSCTVFLPYVLQTKGRNRRAVALAKGLNSKTLACKRQNDPQLTHAVHNYSLQSPQHFTAWWKHINQEAKMGQSFFQCCFKSCSRPSWNKMWIRPGFTVWRRCSERALKMSCPIHTSPESIFSALPASSGYLPKGRWVYQVSAFSGSSPISHGMTQPHRGSATPSPL